MTQSYNSTISNPNPVSRKTNDTGNRINNTYTASETHSSFTHHYKTSQSNTAQSNPNPVPERARRDPEGGRVGGTLRKGAPTMIFVKSNEDGFGDQDLLPYSNQPPYP